MSTTSVLLQTLLPLFQAGSDSRQQDILIGHQTALELLDAESGTSSGDIAALTSDVGDLTTAVGGLTTDVGTLTSEVTVLQGAVETHATSTKLLSDADNGKRIVIDSNTIGGDCTITVPDTLSPNFIGEYRLSGTGGSILFVASGTQNLAYYGQNTVTVENTVVSLFVESATRAELTVIEQL